MENKFNATAFRQLGHILQYVHHHTGSAHQPSMLDTNNMIDQLRHGDTPLATVRTHLAILCDRATRCAAYPPH